MLWLLILNQLILHETLRYGNVKYSVNSMVMDKYFISLTTELTIPIIFFSDCTTKCNFAYIWLELLGAEDCFLSRTSKFVMCSIYYLYLEKRLMKKLRLAHSHQL